MIDGRTDEDNVSLTVVPVPNVGPGLPGLLAVSSRIIDAPDGAANENRAEERRRK